MFDAAKVGHFSYHYTETWTPAILEATLKRVTYKDFRFSLFEQSGLLMLSIEWRAPDNDVPYGERRSYIPVSVKLPIPQVTFTPDYFIKWLFDQCLEVERHETREQFLVDGIALYHPHEKNKYIGVSANRLAVRWVDDPKLADEGSMNMREYMSARRG